MVLDKQRQNEPLQKPSKQASAFEVADWELVESGTDLKDFQEPSDISTPWVRNLRFWLNSEEVVVANPSPTVNLLDWLREVKGLTGAHKGCGEGGCGICSVALAAVNPRTKQCEVVPINSCLRRLCALDGCHIVTVEGIGSKDAGFHAIQKAIADGNGSQCGYCTPGWVMSMYALLEKTPSPTREVVEQHFDGNLCRCTGYRPILSACGEFAKGGRQHCKHSSVQHPAAMRTHVAEPLHFEDPNTKDEWYRVVSFDQYREVCDLAKIAGKKLQLTCASTGDGVTKYLDPENENKVGMVYVDIGSLPGLHDISGSESTELVFGAAVPLSVVIETLEKCKGEPFGTLADHIKRIASVSIRSVASWAGNLMLARNYPTFPSDLATIMAAAGAQVQALDSNSKVQSFSISELLASQEDLLVKSMSIPSCTAGSLFHTFKVGQRHVFAHAIVNFGMSVSFDKDLKVKDSKIFLGGVADHLLEAVQTSSRLQGSRLDQVALKAAAAALEAEITAAPSSNPRQSSSYRQDLALGFLYKVFLAAQTKLPEQYRSALVPFIPADARPISTGTESFGTVPSNAPIHDYIPKMASRIQASGEARYPSDYGQGALFGQLVFSTAANAKLVGLDPSPALAKPGVRDFVVASAIPGMNRINAQADGCPDKIFWEVGDTVPCVGVALGLIVADTWAQARHAAKCVIQRYAGVAPVVSSLEEAKWLGRIMPAEPTSPAKTNSRRGMPFRTEKLQNVDYVEGPPRSDAKLSAKGTFKTGFQSHLYMETHSVVATPLDGNCWEVVISDQDPATTQTSLALVLGVPAKNINIKVPRAGGAFGGKLLRQMLPGSAAVVAARKLRRPVKIQNERSDDMQMNMGREAMDFEYEVTFDESGRVDTMNMTQCFAPGWFYGDCSGDLDMGVGFSDNCYKYNSFKVARHVYKTDTTHCTSMRAPGCMQSLIASEVVMEHVAKLVGKPLEEVQSLNFYKAGDETPFGDRIGTDIYNWTIPTLWPKIQEDADFKARKDAVVKYNSENRWTKKGLAISPVKYVMDQAFYSSGAHICVYGDGSVLVTTGGCEVGQGLDTKVALCVANTLGVPLETISVGPTETSKVPNNTGTGGSGTSESSSQAAIIACQEILEKLKPYSDKGQKWNEAVASAIDDHVPLMASKWFTWKGHMPGKVPNRFLYAVYGTAVSEVLIDVLTGEVCVSRVDVLMDLGTQLDAAVDIGQLQGGFVMSLGYVLTEELKVDSSGTQLNLGTWEYKIPSAYDIPLEFNVSLLKDSPNPVGVKGSKASAEPVMGLVASVYLAVKDAIYAARQEVGLGDSWFMLDLPLTPERIATAIGVPVNQMDVP